MRTSSNYQPDELHNNMCTKDHSEWSGEQNTAENRKRSVALSRMQETENEASHMHTLCGEKGATCAVLSSLYPPFTFPATFPSLHYKRCCIEYVALLSYLIQLRRHMTI